MTTPSTNSALPEVSDARGGGHEPANLGDILERVLDKGLVIAGDIQINLLDIELLTIKLRLVIASLETAKEVGIDWWERDPWLTGDDNHAHHLRQRARARGPAMSEPGRNPLADRINADPETVEHGLVGLVLTIVELLRQLMERQALRRVDTGETVERIGLTLMRLDERMTELCDHFEIGRDESNIDLGSLGPLLADTDDPR